MKRQAQLPTSVRYVDISKNLSEKQLMLIGYVAVLWNEVAEQIDMAIWYGYRLLPETWPDIVGQIPESKKREFIQKGAKLLGLANNVCKIIDETSKSIGEVKEYRDAVVHSRTLDVDSGIAELRSRGKVFEVLRTEDALQGLISRLDIVFGEVISIVAIFDIAKRTHESPPKHEKGKERLEKELQHFVEQLKLLQKTRLSLLPLPAFPK